MNIIDVTVSVMDVTQSIISYKEGGVIFFDYLIGVGKREIYSPGVGRVCGRGLGLHHVGYQGELSSWTVESVLKRSRTAEKVHFQ